MPAGRPLKYKTPEDLKAAIDEYRSQHPDDGEVPTLSGLALHLGTTRKTLYNYEHRDEYLPIIKDARAWIESRIERILVSREGNVTGLIFWLKNNAQWSDRKEHEHSGPGGQPLIPPSNDEERANRLAQFLKSEPEDGTGPDPGGSDLGADTGTTD